MNKEIVFTPDAPAPAHVFSQGIKKGGLFQVPTLMAEQLGDTVHLSTRVQSIVQDDDG